MRASGASSTPAGDGGTLPVVTRLARVALRTAAVDAMRRHYVDVLGLWECGRGRDGAVYLTCGGAGADVELIPAAGAGLDHVAFAVAPRTDLSMLAEGLGCKGQVVESNDPFVAESVRIADVERNQIELSVPSGEFPEVRGGSGIRPCKLGHVATRVRDSSAVRSFYERTLGFAWSDSNADGVVFLRCNADHHSVNLFPISNPGQLHHIAFELDDDPGAIVRAGDYLARQEVPIIWGPGRHGAGHNLFLYHRDPDGNIVELFCQLDVMSDPRQGFFDPRPWHTHRPQVPRIWAPADRRVGGLTPPRPPDFFD